jgi:FkbM family methyltransferase
MQDTHPRDFLFSDQSEARDINIHDRKISFHHPASPFMRNLIMGIFQGHDYPIYRYPNYSPDIIFDIGANIGATAVYFHAAFPGAQIFCYEPSIRNFHYLEKNTESFANIHTFPYGLYDRSSNFPIYLGKDQCAQDSIFLNNETTNVHETARLVRASEELSDRGIQRISILKIDTEGCEIPILREFEIAGGGNMPIDMLYVEYHSEEDRLNIDKLMSERFLLLFSKATQIHRGSILYISRSLASTYPESESLRIQTPFSFKAPH